MTTREMLERLGYRCAGKTPQAVWNAADRERRRHQLRVKQLPGRPILYYAEDVDRVANSGIDHKYAA